MTTTSLSLLERASRRDDSRSWNRLAELYRPLLRYWLNRFGVQHADSEDLIQDVLLTVARELPSFRHNERKGAFRSWLRVVLTNRMKDFLRSRQHRPIATGKSSVLEQLEKLADERSDISRLRDHEHNAYVIRKLTAAVEPRFESKTWTAFCRQVLDGLSAHEVAIELSMPLSSVYVAKSRVLTALRQEAKGLID